MLYEPGEVKISEIQLEKIFKNIPSPICLLGGWATYHLVNRSFEKTHGRKYIGSRDIDLGFHLEKHWNEEHLIKSEFIAAVKTMEKMGFRSVNFRLVKDFNLDTGMELTAAESGRVPLYQIFQLYIDPIVDYIHPKIKDLIGFIPIDEPLLSLVFQNKMYTSANIFNKTILLPKPHVLLAMKLNSVLNRDKENKRIKDIADIYAILWHSDISLNELKDQLFSIYPKEKARKIAQSFTREDINKSSTAIGVKAQEISRVLAELK
ncbi:MAG: nucleotidyl transferase AbiEii/AbiGii toxin family protein [Candidatus Methanomethylicaceae archaeon]